MKKHVLLFALVASLSPIIAMDGDESDTEVWELDVVFSENPELKRQVRQLMPAQDFSGSQQEYVYRQAEKLVEQLDEELQNPHSPYNRWKLEGLNEEQILTRFVIETAHSTRSSDQMPYIPTWFQHPYLYPERSASRLISTK